MGFTSKVSKKAELIFFKPLKVLATEDAKETGILGEISFPGKPASGVAVFTATKKFVQARNLSPNFRARMPATQQHPKFFSALMATHSATRGESSFREVDTLSCSAKAVPELIHVDGYGLLEQYAIDDELNLFSRGSYERNGTKLPQDRVLGGYGYLLNDPYFARADGGFGALTLHIFTPQQPVSRQSLDSVLADASSIFAGESKVFNRMLFVMYDQEEGQATMAEIKSFHDSHDYEEIIEQITKAVKNGSPLFYRRGFQPVYFDYSLYCTENKYGESKLSKRLKKAEKRLGLDETQALSLNVQKGPVRNLRKEVVLGPVLASQSFYCKDEVIIPGAGRSFIFLRGEYNFLAKLNKLPDDVVNSISNKIGISENEQILGIKKNTIDDDNRPSDGIKVSTPAHENEEVNFEMGGEL